MDRTIRQLAPDEFPPRLFEIPDPPKELWLAGELPSVLEYKYLTVVGSRKISQYGRDACEKIVGGLAGCPIVIVSGLAIGTDAKAHQEALRAGLKTVAIPGSGLAPGWLYPESNQRLADQIVAAGGALLSEYPPETKAALHTFPRRNRLMAGISQATLIVEAGEKSGTLITYRLALDYNRDILAVPGSILAPNSWGPNWLIARGAAVVTNSNDVLLALGLEVKEPENNLADKLAELSPLEQKIVELLSDSAQPRDELVNALNIAIDKANATLAMLEIKGVIKETLGEIRLI